MTRKTRNKRLIIVGVAITAVAIMLGTVWFTLPKLRALAERTSNLGEDLSDAYHAGALAQRLMDDDPEQVLMIFQNSWELRPTGGFITALGEGTILRGQLEGLKVVPSNAYDLQKNIEVPLPLPMQGWISTPELELRDANWDPDFPTAAATIQRMYTDATGRVPDLVIAITTSATEHLVNATGPVIFTINGQTITLTADNVTGELERLTDVDFATLGLSQSDRKQILAAFAAELLPKVQRFIWQDPIKALNLTTELLETHDVQIWSADSQLDNHLAALDARKEIGPAAQDALLLVDTNLGAFKTDPFIQRSAYLAVTVAQESILKLTYENTSTSDDRLTTTYNDYVRIYVPEKSSLISATGLTNVKTSERHGRTVFEGRLQIPQGEKRDVTIKYKNSSTPTSFDGYSLLLERQAGSQPYSIILEINDGWDDRGIQKKRVLQGSTQKEMELR